MGRRRIRPRAVVDTNLFVSGTILKRGSPFALLEAWRAGAFDLVLPDDQFAELSTVFQRPRIVQRYGLSLDEIAILLATLAAFPHAVPVAILPVTVRDPEDEMILAAALGGGADYLVTGDGDLLELRGNPGLGALKIVTAVDFLGGLASAGPGACDSDG